MMTFKQFAETLDKLDGQDLLEEARRRRRSNLFRRPKSKWRGLRRFRNISPKSIYLPTLMGQPTPRQELSKVIQKGVAKPIQKPVANAMAKGGGNVSQKPPPKPFKTSPISRAVKPVRPRPLQGSPDEAKMLAQKTRV